MELFRTGNLDVLVATTVIEVGVDVPNATVMVILDAGRFGIAQLHQLRGRVGRGEHVSTCWMVGEASTEDGEARMEALVASTDGFELAEVDLDLRGAARMLVRRAKPAPGWWIVVPQRLCTMVVRGLGHAFLCLSVCLWNECEEQPRPRASRPGRPGQKAAAPPRQHFGP